MLFGLFDLGLGEQAPDLVSLARLVQGVGMSRPIITHLRTFFAAVRALNALRDVGDGGQLAQTKFQLAKFACGNRGIFPTLLPNVHL